ncbi:VanZ family protein [soil metagenome]
MSSLSNTPKAVWWTFALLWAGLIFWPSNSPDARGGGSLLALLPYGDKLAHGTAFGVLGALLYAASGRVGVALGLATLYGVSDELHQSFVPGRSSDLFDLLADTLGAALFIFLVRYLTRRLSVRTNPVQ